MLSQEPPQSPASRNGRICAAAVKLPFLTGRSDGELPVYRCPGRSGNFRIHAAAGEPAARDIVSCVEYAALINYAGYCTSADCLEKPSGSQGTHFKTTESCRTRGRSASAPTFRQGPRPHGLRLKRTAGFV